MKILSRYDLGQLNIRLPKKDYKITASQDDNYTNRYTNSILRVKTFPNK